VLVLAKSWLSPPGLHAVGDAVSNAEYDPAQRAFVVQLKPGAKRSAVLLTLDASPQSPLVNPAFVIENWSGGVKVRINGHPLKSPESVRVGSSQSIERDSLVLWMPLDSTQKTEIRLEPIL
jgi:hypothetical protein